MTIKCPRCEKDLMNVDRQGIVVDFCPKCKGVWLDKEELDEIIKRTSGIFSETIEEEQKDDAEPKFPIEDTSLLDDYEEFKEDES